MMLSQAEKDISEIDKSRSIPTRSTIMHEQVATYRVSKHQSKENLTLVDRGANGGLAGGDMRVVRATDKIVNVTGIDDHQLNGLKVVTAVG